ncbi:MAG TPA: protein translocase subunit SecD [Acidimicrobiales bacterium]|nr:protein translocase subunit SecD [Acidimicrobiales bacterium]
MKRSLVISLTLVVGITIVFLAATLGAGWSPKLGLDLAGGSEIVYKPARTITAGELQTTINVIRNRVDAAGVSGANVNSQGGNVVVQLPGLKDPQKVINLIGQTAQMQFRPVLCASAPYTKPTKATKLPPLPSTCSASQYSQQAPNLTVTPNSSAQGYATNQGSISPDPALAAYKTTTPAYDDKHPHLPVLVPLLGGGGLRYLLGPSELSGTAIASAQAQFVSPSWVVNATLTGKGAPAWDKLSQKYFHEMIGIDLDGQVQSNPLTQPSQATFTSFAGKVEISGNFTQASAQNLALDLNYGSLPVRLVRINQETVSPTLGKSSLKAGLAAGIGGLLLVLIYTILYYRALGIVVVSGLAVTAALLFAIVSALSHSALNLTLDLSGVTGLIVSVGITVDSYIVYFERLKDEVRSGRSVRTSVDKSFQGAFRTVLAADLVSLAAAVVLYLLAVGTVRGFAFFLGLSTLLDVFTTYFFTRPLVIMLGRNAKITGARLIGVARGLAIDSGAPS